VHEDLTGKARRPVAQVRPVGIGSDQAERLERPGAAIVRPAIVQPAAVEAHEVAEAPVAGVPGMPDEGGGGVGDPRGGLIRQRRYAREKSKRARIVVRAISVSAIRHGIDRVLHDPAIVCNPAHGLDAGASKRAESLVLPLAIITARGGSERDLRASHLPPSRRLA
jgi:hypothetical protein